MRGSQPNLLSTNRMGFKYQLHVDDDSVDDSDFSLAEDESESRHKRHQDKGLIGRSAGHSSRSGHPHQSKKSKSSMHLEVNSDDEDDSGSSEEGSFFVQTSDTSLASSEDVPKTLNAHIPEVILNHRRAPKNHPSPSIISLIFDDSSNKNDDMVMSDDDEGGGGGDHDSFRQCEERYHALMGDSQLLVDSNLDDDNSSTLSSLLGEEHVYIGRTESSANLIQVGSNSAASAYPYFVGSEINFVSSPLAQVEERDNCEEADFGNTHVDRKDFFSIQNHSPVNLLVDFSLASSKGVRETDAISRRSPAPFSYLSSLAATPGRTHTFSHTDHKLTIKHSRSIDTCSSEERFLPPGRLNVSKSARERIDSVASTSSLFYYSDCDTTTFGSVGGAGSSSLDKNMTRQQHFYYHNHETIPPFLDGGLKIHDYDIGDLPALAIHEIKSEPQDHQHENPFFREDHIIPANDIPAIESKASTLSSSLVRDKTKLASRHNKKRDPCKQKLNICHSQYNDSNCVSTASTRKDKTLEMNLTLSVDRELDEYDWDAHVEHAFATKDTPPFSIISIPKDWKQQGQHRVESGNHANDGNENVCTSEPPSPSSGNHGRSLTSRLKSLFSNSEIKNIQNRDDRNGEDALLQRSHRSRSSSSSRVQVRRKKTAEAGEVDGNSLEMVNPSNDNDVELSLLNQEEVKRLKKMEENEKGRISCSSTCGSANDDNRSVSSRNSFWSIRSDGTKEKSGNKIESKKKGKDRGDNKEKTDYDTKDVDLSLLDQEEVKRLKKMEENKKGRISCGSACGSANDDNRSVSSRNSFWSIRSDGTKGKSGNKIESKKKGKDRGDNREKTEYGKVQQIEGKEKRIGDFSKEDSKSVASRNSTGNSVATNNSASHSVKSRQSACESVSSQESLSSRKSFFSCQSVKLSKKCKADCHSATVDNFDPSRLDIEKKWNFLSFLLKRKLAKTSSVEKKRNNTKFSGTRTSLGNEEDMTVPTAEMSDASFLTQFLNEVSFISVDECSSAKSLPYSGQGSKTIPKNTKISVNALDDQSTSRAQLRLKDLHKGLRPPKPSNRELDDSLAVDGPVLVQDHSILVACNQPLAIPLLPSLTGEVNSNHEPSSHRARDTVSVDSGESIAHSRGRIPGPMNHTNHEVSRKPPKPVRGGSACSPLQSPEKVVLRSTSIGSVDSRNSTGAASVVTDYSEMSMDDESTTPSPRNSQFPKAVIVKGISSVPISSTRVMRKGSLVTNRVRDEDNASSSSKSQTNSLKKTGDKRVEVEFSSNVSLPHRRIKSDEGAAHLSPTVSPMIQVNDHYRHNSDGSVVSRTAAPLSPSRKPPSHNRQSSSSTQSVASTTSRSSAHSKASTSTKGSIHSKASSNSRNSSASSKDSVRTENSWETVSTRDPCARQSKIVKNSPRLQAMAQKGDGDVWVEKLYKSKRTGEFKVYFVSTNTGKRSRDEPPSGASRIVYRDYEARYQ